MKTGDVRRMEMYHKRTFEMIFEPANGICMQNMNRLLSLKASAKIRGEM
jgi:hypothetical protein